MISWPRSLKARFLVWLTLAASVVLSINIVVLVTSSLSFVNNAYDSVLFGSAQAMANGVGKWGDALDATVSFVSIGMLETNLGGPIYYRVRERNGRVLAGFADVPDPPKAEGRQPQYFNAVYNETDLRWIALRVPVVMPNFTDVVLVQVGQPRAGRQVQLKNIVTTILSQQLILALLSVCAVWFGIHKTLKLLIRIGRETASREERDLRPISLNNVPSEVQPFLKAINGLLWRTAQEAESQQRFIADASHQLKTPLAIMQTNTDLALRQTELSAAKELLRRIDKTVAYTSRLTHQLLSLVSVKTRADAAETVLDLAKLATRVTADRVPWALGRHIDLGFEADSHSVPVRADPVLAAELVSNLIDNAVRYNSPGGHVTVRVRSQPPTAALEVVDDGPGIPIEQRQAVFQRFATTTTRSEPSCGLGLAIVKEITEAHGGQVSLADPPSGSGLIVTVRLPLSDLCCRS